FAGPFAEDEQVGQRIAAEAIGPIDPGRAFAAGKQARHARHLRIAVDADAAHDVMGRWTDFHRLTRDVDVAQLFELMIHAGQLPFDVLGRVGDLGLDPGDVEVDAPVWGAAALLYFADDAAGHVIACQQLGRSLGVA